ncbi:DUF4277 domain-containing protein [Legionella sp. km535]|nr:DUF4277 domain-containing protein [Legionella sp. km535]
MTCKRESITRLERESFSAVSLLFSACRVFLKNLTQIFDFDLLLTFGERKVTLQAYTSKSVDHLDLVSALCQGLGIAEFVDHQLPNQSQHRHISYGQLLVAMILNGLGFVS